MSENTETAPSPSSTITCSNCHSTMPSELRFCRNCGFRLGSGFGDPNQLVQSASAPLQAPKKRRRRSGMTWIFVGLLIFFIGAAAFTAIINPIRDNVATVVKNPVIKAYVGVDGWDTVENGVTFGSVNAPGGPADKAGLVGGDVITKFDGQEIRDEDQMEELLTRTPIGKTVEVEYIRDGERKTTKLTTIPYEEFRRLSREFEKRPEGRGVFGYEDGDTERVQIPGTNIWGVKLNSILRSRPADLAGVKEGDIVIEFDGVPIRTPDEFLSRVKRALPYSTVDVVVMRGEEKVEIPVKIGKQ
jgi:membrane-associated protease RseP (regulator of RpoE activity)